MQPSKALVLTALVIISWAVVTTGAHFLGLLVLALVEAIGG